MEQGRAGLETRQEGRRLSWKIGDLAIFLDLANSTAGILGNPLMIQLLEETMLWSFYNLQLKIGKMNQL